MSIHVALRTRVQLGRKGNLLALCLGSPGDVLGGTAGLLWQFASAVLTSATQALESGNAKAGVLEVSTLSVIAKAWNLQNLQLGDVPSPKQGKRTREGVNCPQCLPLVASSALFCSLPASVRWKRKSYAS